MKDFKELKDYPVIFSIPVEWGEMDSFGHVNNTIYFRWCETARVEYLEKVGLTLKFKDQGVGPILARLQCNFRKPVTYPDTVHIGARVARIGNRSLEMEHAVVSAEQGLVAVADSTIVVLDYTAGRTVRVPETVRAAIAELENKDF